MNVFTVCGNLGKDCELKYLPDGTAIGEFSVASQSGYGEKKKTTWINCSLFGTRAEKIYTYLTKGSKPVVSGQIFLDEYEKDGIKHKSLKMKVSEVTLTGSRNSSSVPPPVQQFQSVVEDVPF